jgi:hypothetical protein
MEKYLFMKKVIDSISQGDFFRKAFAIFLRVLALVITITGLVAWVMIWKTMSGETVKMVAGIVIFQILFILALYMAVHALLIRAGHISELSDSDYTVIPITSVFFKLCGEMYASFATVMSLAGGVLIWFVGREAFYFIGKVSIFKYGFLSGSDFLGGLTFIVGGWLVAFFVLVIFYFLSEAVVVMTDIARNTKKGK